MRPRNRSVDINETSIFILRHIHWAHRIQYYNFLWLRSKQSKKTTTTYAWYTKTHKFSMKIAMLFFCCLFSCLFSWERNYFVILFDVKTISMAIFTAIIFIFAIYVLFGFWSHFDFVTSFFFCFLSHQHIRIDLQWNVLALGKIWQFSCCCCCCSSSLFLFPHGDGVYTIVGLFYVCVFFRWQTRNEQWVCKQKERLRV